MSKKKLTTNEKYGLFARAYVTNGFNGKKAAITAGYSEKSAEVTASKLLRIAKVLEIIDAEMKMLSERMRDDASRIYFELWDQVRMIDDKMAKHEEASEQLNITDARTVVMKADITNLKSKIRRKEAKFNKIDGRTSKGRTEKNDLKKELEGLNLELEESKESLEDLDSLAATSRRDLLWHRDWKEMLTLRTQILQDLFDRAGYKEMRELQDRRLRLLDAQINKLELESKKDDKNSGTTTIIMSSTDEMQAYLDKKAGADSERNDSQEVN